VEFSVRRRTSGAVGVVEVCGELDAETADAFEACTLALLAEVRHVVVDLQHTDFVDCRGLSSLLHLSRLADTVGAGFRTTGARPVVRLLFDALGVTGRLGAGDVGTDVDLRAPLHAVGR
jgi:anti-anti-sigma factor